MRHARNATYRRRPLGRFRFPNAFIHTSEETLSERNSEPVCHGPEKEADLRLGFSKLGPPVRPSVVSLVAMVTRPSGPLFTDEVLIHGLCSRF